ncbi:GNAT family N-acetyltransferase [Nocardia sp. CDC159]|uniref:GNAT family N-acetyltransferase n=1 Tax=Nocardia pulmonis TaxID=2951408 RepID=A0A9X2E931_9NOCA|nr:MULTISPECIES: GNAT family N-acetyltransferase [Nocardia]MCM6773986.1 GNAT family N-acetyltransferase [Nocardia pulmonis]MCM6786873.1 GNAT family N-acetyltransferase [Nocardia sp. CDC159]
MFESFDSDLHAYLRAQTADHTHRVGRFVLLLDSEDSGPFRNYAVPDDGADPAPAEIEELVAAFTERGRTPRLEYLEKPCPRLEPALLAAGFRVEARLPISVCPPADAVAHATDDSIELLLAATDDDLWMAAAVQNDAYGAPAPSPHDLARLRRTVDGGGLVALARDRRTGHGVGSGLCGTPHSGISEVAAIGVRATYRRRGIATALVGMLTRSCPAAGITTPFLMAETPAEERIYHRIGYRRTGWMMHISR